jgi:hypothetical protein
MAAQIPINQLPPAGPITGQELVPIVQNGQTVQTTTFDISSTPSQTQSFLTVNQELSLPNSRYLAVNTGLGLTDGGATSFLRISLNGASGSLESASNGLIVKTASNSVTSRLLNTSGVGLSISNANGVSGDPTLSLSGLASAFANLGGSGIPYVNSGTTVGLRQLLGTANQIDVTNGTGVAGDPTISIVSDAVLPGTGAVTFPKGTTAERPGGINGQFRYNTTTGVFEGYANGSWGAVTTGGVGVTSIILGNGLSGTPNPITSSGTITIDTTIVATLADTQTLTNKTISGSSNTLSNIGNASLTNSSLTYNGVTVSLGGAGTITAANPNALTVGTGLQLDSGTTYDGSAARTISLTNTSITIGSTSISLGGTSLTLAGLSSVTVTADPTTALQLATKQYVDGLASTGLIYHSPAQVATTQSLAAQTGGSVTYNNGSSGVGATLTLGIALTTLDGYSLVNGDRILVKNETTQAYNGVYTWATGGTVLTRSTDTDSYGTGTGDISENDYFFIQNGTVNKGSSYVCTTAGTIVFGTTAITFAQFSTSQVYTGTSPIQVSGTTISLNTVPVASGGTNITSYATGDMLYASASTTLAKLTLGTLGYVMTAGASAPQYVAQSTLSVGTATNIAGGAAGSLPYNSASGTTTFLSLGTTNYVLTAGASAPQYVAQSTLSVGSATNATNTAITANSTNATNYLTFVSATTGNLPQLVNSSISCNPSTGQVTGGISGGAF